jgi:hypothetical protein
MNSLWVRISDTKETVDFGKRSWNLAPGNAIEVLVRISDNTTSMIKVKGNPNSRLFCFVLVVGLSALQP